MSSGRFVISYLPWQCSRGEVDPNIQRISDLIFFSLLVSVCKGKIIIGKFGKYCQYRRLYIASTVGFILPVQEALYCQYRRLYIASTGRFTLPVQEALYCQYRRLYIASTGGFILPVQEAL
jgi:hypothetical protein